MLANGNLDAVIRTALFVIIGKLLFFPKKKAICIFILLSIYYFG